jgi:hypothetical protein
MENNCRKYFLLFCLITLGGYLQAYPQIAQSGLFPSPSSEHALLSDNDAEEVSPEALFLSGTSSSHSQSIAYRLEVAEIEEEEEKKERGQKLGSQKQESPLGSSPSSISLLEELYLLPSSASESFFTLFRRFPSFKSIQVTFCVFRL